MLARELDGFYLLEAVTISISPGYGVEEQNAKEMNQGINVGRCKK
jgi:hypothetical protein